jgi:O-antigen ligase
MSTAAVGAADRPRWPEAAGWWLLLAAVLGLFFLVHWVAAVVVLGFALLQRARPLDFLAAYLLVVAGGTFVDYTHGTLTLLLSLLSIGILFMFTCYLVAFRHEALAVRRTPLTAWLLLYGAATAVSLLRGLLAGNSLRFAGLELLAVLALLSSLLVANLQMERARVMAILAVLWTAALGHAAVGIQFFAEARTRTGGIYFTAVSGLIAVLLFNFALRGATPRQRWLPMLALLPLVAHQFLSFTRGYWLGLIAGVAWSVATYAGRGPGARQRWARAGRLLAGFALVLTVAMALLSAVFDIPGIAQGAWRRLSTSAGLQYTSETASNFVRLLEYDRVLKDIATAPLWGRGLGHSIVTRDPFFRTMQEQWFVHQNYLLVWLKQGLPGLVFFVGSLVAAVALGMRGRRLAEPWAAAWCAGTAAVTIQVMVVANMHYPLGEVNATFVVALLWGVTMALTSQDRWRLVWRSGSGRGQAG